MRWGSRRTLTLLLAMALLLSLGWVALGHQSARPKPPETAHGQRLAVFWGDSWFNGAGPVRVQQTFGYLAGSALGYTTVILGHGGTGYVAARRKPPVPNFPGQIQHGALRNSGHEADLVLLEGGLLDYGYPCAVLGHNARSVITALRAAYPHARVVVLGPADPGSPQGRRLQVGRTDACLDLVAQKARVAFIDGRSLLPTATLRANLLPDGLHPTLRGHRLLARQLQRALIHVGVPVAS